MMDNLITIHVLGLKGEDIYQKFYEIYGRPTLFKNDPIILECFKQLKKESGITNFDKTICKIILEFGEL